MKRYIIEDELKCRWCGSIIGFSYWSRIGDYRKESISFNWFTGHLMMFMIHLTSNNKCKLAEVF